MEKSIATLRARDGEMMRSLEGEERSTNGAHLNTRDNK